VDIAAGHRVADAEQLKAPLRVGFDRLRLALDDGPQIGLAAIARMGLEREIELVERQGAVLEPGSRNGGEVDYQALIEGRPQVVTRNPDGRYRLFRIGDAVASRNVHAAIYDALRLCMAL